MRMFIIVYLYICLFNMIIYKYIINNLKKDKECAEILIKEYGKDCLSVSSLKAKDYFSMLCPILNFLIFIISFSCLLSLEEFKKDIKATGGR